MRINQTIIPLPPVLTLFVLIVIHPLYSQQNDSFCGLFILGNYNPKANGYVNAEAALLTDLVATIKESMTMEILLKALAYITSAGIVAVALFWAIWTDLKRDTKGRLFFGYEGLLMSVFATIPVIIIVYILFKTNQANPDQKAPLWFVFMSAATLLLPAYCWAEYIWTKGFFSDKGIGFQSIWNGRRYYPWSELRYLAYNKYMMWYVFGFEDGGEIRIPVLMSGFPELFDKLEALEFIPTSKAM